MTNPYRYRRTSRKAQARERRVAERAGITVEQYRRVRAPADEPDPAIADWLAWRTERDSATRNSR